MPSTIALGSVLFCLMMWIGMGIGIHQWLSRPHGYATLMGSIISFVMILIVLSPVFLSLALTIMFFDLYFFL